jgi:hypothetical protein
MEFKDHQEDGCITESHLNLIKSLKASWSLYNKYCTYIQGLCRSYIALFLDAAVGKLKKRLPWHLCSNGGLVTCKTHHPSSPLPFSQCVTRVFHSSIGLIVEVIAYDICMSIIIPLTYTNVIKETKTERANRTACPPRGKTLG